MPTSAPDPNLQLALVCVATMLSGMVNAASGVGGAAVLLPLLLLFMEPKTALVVVALSQISRNFTLTLATFRSARLQVVWRLAAGGILGAIGGALLIGSIPDLWIRRLLGLGLLAFVTNELARPDRKHHIPLEVMPAVGTMTGGVSALFGTAGPITAPFLYWYGLTAVPLVATLTASSLITNLAKLSTYAALGFYKNIGVAMTVGTVVSVVIGTELGVFILKRFDARHFRMVFLGMLTVVALTYLFGPVKENPAAADARLHAARRQKFLEQHE